MPEGVFANSDVDSICMVPLAGRPMIYWQVQSLYKQGCRTFRIGVPKRGTRVEDFVTHALRHLHLEASFVVPEEDRGPGYTVSVLLRDLPPAIDSVLIVLGDTHFALADTARPDTSFVLTSRVTDTHRFARFGSFEEQGTTGARPRFFEKGQGGDRREFPALIGVYFLSCLAAVQRCTEAACAKEGTVALTTILNALVDERHEIDPIEAAAWYDVGHADRQILAHQALLQEAARHEDRTT